MDEKYYKKYLKYKNKYALLKNSFSNKMYAQYGGFPVVDNLSKVTLSAKVSPQTKPEPAYVEMVGVNSPPVLPPTSTIPGRYENVNPRK